MTTTYDDELKTALRVVAEHGFDVVIAAQYRQLRVWLDRGGKGWPPNGWTAEKPMPRGRR